MATYTPQQFGGFTLPGGYQGNFLNIVRDPRAFINRNVNRVVENVTNPTAAIVRNAPKVANTAIDTVANYTPGLSPLARGLTTLQQQNQQSGQVQGVVDTNKPTPAPVPENVDMSGFDARLAELLYSGGSMPRGYAVGGSSSRGGSFGGSSQSVGFGNQMLDTITQNRDAQISQIEADYQAAIKLLGDTEATTRGEYGKGVEYLQKSEAANRDRLNTQLGINKNQLRQGYQDATTLARQRARAVGGTASSGYLDTLEDLDKTLLEQLGGQDQAAQSNLTQVALQAQKLVADLETQLQKTIDTINSQKNVSLREKDKAIQQAKIDASNDAIEIKKWVMGQQSSGARSSGRGGGTSIAQAAKNALNNTYSNFTVALDEANSLPPAQREAAVNKVRAMFASKVVGQGGNLETLNKLESYSPYSKQEKFNTEYEDVGFGINPRTGKLMTPEETAAFRLKYGYSQ